MEFKIPRSLKLQQEELQAELVKLLFYLPYKAKKVSEKTRAAAEAAEKVLHSHFVKEEEFVFPPLALMPLLAEGKVRPEMESVLAMTEKLKTELPQMLEEHKAIGAALKSLMAAATKENKPEYVRFARKLMRYMQNEEHLFYPASMLVGEYLRLKLMKRDAQG